MSAVEYDDTIFDKFMFLAVEANDITPLDHGSHIQIPSIWILVTGRTNKRSLLKQAGSDPRWQSLKGDRRRIVVYFGPPSGNARNSTPRPWRLTTPQIFQETTFL
jgi:hypothetical protein